MAENTKTKVLQINTQGAEKNVKSLKTQIRELKEQLAQLDKGTVEYDKVSKQLADTNQKQIEINEAMKYSNKDLGATLSNLTKVSAGVVGAISSVNSVMVLMGADSEEAQEAMKKIQSLMAIIQGLSAIDTAVKALKGLTVAFQGFNDVRVKSITTSVGASGAELAEAGALAENTVKMSKNNEEAKEFNRLNKEGKVATDKSKEAIDRETKALIANKEAKSGNIEAAKQLVDLQIKQKETVKSATDFANEAVQGQIDGLKKKLDAFEKEYKQGLDLGHTEANDNRMSFLSGKINRLKTEIKYFETEVLNSADVITAGWGMAVEEGFSMYDDAVDDAIKQMLSAMSPTQLEAASKNLENFVTAKAREIQNLGHLTSEEIEAELDRLVAYAEEQDALINQAIANKQAQVMKENLLQKEIKETADAEDAETAATNANTAAKKANADATEDVADAEKKLGDGIQKREPILRKIGSGFKTFFTKTVPNGFKSLLNFVKLNPIFVGLSAIVAGIGYGISKWISAYNDAHKEAYELKKMNIELDMEFKKQKTDMETLLRMFYQENLTAKEKETLAKEINKLAGDELVARNKITGEWEIQIEKMQEYQRNLRTQIELEYHKKAILEAMDKEEEARQDANYEKNHFIGNLFRTETGYLKDASEAVAEQEKHWKAIEKLTTNVVENIDKENKKLQKNTTGGGGIKKSFADLLKELKALWKDFYAQLTKEKELKRVFNGIYSEALVAYDKAVEAINGSMFGKKISKDFVKAFEGGLKDIKSNEITLDMIFVDTEDLDKQLEDAKNVLRKLFNEGKKVTDKQVQDAKKRIDQIKEEIAGYETIAKSVYDYKKALEDLEKTRKETNDANTLYNKQQDINTNYRARIRREQGSDFQYEETNKEIEQQRLLYQTTMNRLTEEKARLDELNQSNLRNKATIEEIAELEKKIAEDQKAANEAQIQMDELRYQNRMTKLQEEYAAIDKNSEIAQQWYEIEQSIKGGGAADYNIDVDLLEMQLEAIVEKANMVDEYYEKLQEQHDENSQEWYVLEQERLAAQEALQRQYMDKEIEMEQEKSKRRLAIAKTYVAAYQSISSQISNILSAEMDKYSDNKEKYKRLKYAQGVITTAEGVLSAFMSGFESGIPWPGNAILAGVLSGMALIAGRIQLENIKHEKLGGDMPNTVNIGSEYDTLSYAQGAETLSAIQDQRVYVVESDITDTQNRVEVAESGATF